MISSLKLKNKILGLSMRKLLDYIQLLVSLATIASVYFAYKGFTETMDIQRETYAIQLYTTYFDLYENNIQFVDSIVVNSESKWSLQYEAFAQRVLFTAESIYNIRGGSPSWDKTITYMLSPHLKYYKKNESVNDAFSEDFKEFFSSINN